METDLNKIILNFPHMTAAEWLQTQPEMWRQLETEAINECLKRGLPLDRMEIQSVAREIDANLNPKVWKNWSER